MIDFGKILLVIFAPTLTEFAFIILGCFAGETIYRYTDSNLLAILAFILITVGGMFPMGSLFWYLFEKEFSSDL